MIFFIFTNETGIGGFLSGLAYSPFLRGIVIAEIVTCIIGIVFGSIAEPKKRTKIIFYILLGIGLLLILKTIFFGISSDANIIIPFLGEGLVVASGAALIAMRRTMLHSSQKKNK